MLGRPRKKKWVGLCLGTEGERPESRESVPSGARSSREGTCVSPSEFKSLQLERQPLPPAERILRSKDQGFPVPAGMPFLLSAGNGLH